MINLVIELSMKYNLQTQLFAFTVTDEEGLQHVNEEMEAKVAAPFISDRFYFLFIFLAFLYFVYNLPFH